MIPPHLTDESKVLYRGEVVFVEIADKPFTIIETPMAYYFVPACEFDAELKKHSVVRIGKDAEENYIE